MDFISAILKVFWYYLFCKKGNEFSPDQIKFTPPVAIVKVHAQAMLLSHIKQAKPA